jgi:hypothetical protein
MTRPPRVLWLLIVPFIIGAAYFGSKTGAPLRRRPDNGSGTDRRLRNLVVLELAPTEAAASAILRDWQATDPAQWRSRALASLAWDTPFILCYAPLFAALCWLAAPAWEGRWPVTASFGRLLAGAQLLAGFCDFMENAALRRVIIGAPEIRQPWPALSCTASSIKWLLLLKAVLFLMGTPVAAFWPRASH